MSIVASIHPAYQNISITEIGTDRSVEALADTGQFVVSAGYAKVNTIEVPQRRGIAVFAGFDPITATFPIILDNFGVEAGYATEEGCELLEYLAGRGRGPGQSLTGAAEAGKKAPRVIIGASDGLENVTKLLPANYNSFGNISPTPEWFVTGLVWGDSIRNGSFPYQRLRQKVTITLTEYNETPGLAHVNPNEIDWEKVTVKKSRTKKNAGESATEMVQYASGTANIKWPGDVVPQLAQELLARWDKKHKGKLKVPHVNSPFKVGIQVEVPYKK